MLEIQVYTLLDIDINGVVGEYNPDPACIDRQNEVLRLVRGVRLSWLFSTVICPCLFDCRDIFRRFDFENGLDGCL